MSYHYKPYSCHHAIKRYIHKNDNSNNDKSVLLIVNLQNDFLSPITPNSNTMDSANSNMINSINELIDSNVFDYYVYVQDIHSPNHVSLASSYEGMIPFEVINSNPQQQLLWPDHCIKSDNGFKFPENLIVPFIGIDTNTENDSIVYDDTKYIDSILDCSSILKEKSSLKITDIEKRLINKSYILRTGDRSNIEPFSAFKNADKSETGLAKFLIRKHINNVYVCGLIRNYNAWWTAADATTYENNDTLKKEFKVHFVLDATLAGPTSVDLPDNRLLPPNVNIESVLTDLNKNNVMNNKWVQAFLQPYGIITISWKDTITKLQEGNEEKQKEKEKEKQKQTISQSLGLTGGSIFKKNNGNPSGYFVDRRKKSNVNMQHVDLDFLLKISK